MPNWVKNIIHVTGAEKDISSMMQYIRSDDRPFDFENLIPMPKELDVTSGGIRDYAILYYISDRLRLSVTEIKSHKFAGYLGRYISVEEQIRRLKEGIEKDHYDVHELYSEGKVYVSNIEKYGYTDWYDWACAHWGTKWNACEADVCRETPTECWIYFDTAWSLPEPIIIKLVSKYPQLHFEGKWADEDLGNNCGRWESCDGLPLFTVVETLQFACEVWDYDYDEMCEEYGWDEESDEEEPVIADLEEDDDNWELDDEFSITDLISGTELQ